MTLKTETNTPEMAERIREAFVALKGQHGDLFFEHGQWWVHIPRTGQAFSAVDAVGGPDTVCDGFAFEEMRWELS